MTNETAKAPTAETPLAIVLAAGKSTRMKSALPKVVHEICGRPMVEYVLESARAAGIGQIVVVIGHGGDLVRSLLAGSPDISFVVQAEQKGTGHAVMVCREHLAGRTGPVCVMAGDTPLLRSESLRGLMDEVRNNDANCAIGTAVTDASQGL